MPKKKKYAAASASVKGDLFVGDMPSVFPQGCRALADYRVGAPWLGGLWTTAMRIELAADANGRAHLVVGLEAEHLPHVLVARPVPRIGFCLMQCAVWFLVVRGGAIAMTPMSTTLAGTRWSSEARVLLGCRKPALLLAVTFGGTIKTLTALEPHPRWWKALRDGIGLVPACSLERFIKITRADGAFMGAMGCIGSIVRFADDGELDLF